MDADEQRMIFFQHGAQRGRDALGQKNRDARADAQKLQMRNGPQLAAKDTPAFRRSKATGRRRSATRPESPVCWRTYSI